MRYFGRLPGHVLEKDVVRREVPSTPGQARDVQISGVIYLQRRLQERSFQAQALFVVLSASQAGPKKREGKKKIRKKPGRFDGRKWGP